MTYFSDCYSLADYAPMWVMVAIILSAAASFYAYPIIIYVSHRKGLMDEPNMRSVHENKVPTLGGVGIFFGVTLVLTFLGSGLASGAIAYLLGALILLFFMGMKDDLVMLTPKKKFLGQIIAALCVILLSDVRIIGFSGLFSVDVLPYVLSVVFTLFVFVLLINAFNLIDGVDGLAGSVGLLASLFFGVYFYQIKAESMLLISFALVGALCPFLFFNFSNKRKIFMGDTGSMIVGFLLAYQGVNFIALNQSEAFEYQVANSPVIVMAVFAFPLLDTLRVFIVRMLQKQSPFEADQNHIHHRLLVLGLKHWQITMTVSIFCVFMMVLACLLSSLSIYYHFVIVLVIGVVIALLPFCIHSKKSKEKTL